MRLYRDSEISDRVWNLYIKKYCHQYLLRKDEQGIWTVRCKYGSIQPYSIINKKLCFVAEYPTSRKKTFALKNLPKFCTLTQEGDADFVCSFDEDKLGLLENVFIIRKKRKLSKETREQLSQHMINVRSSKIAF